MEFVVEVGKDRIPNLLGLLVPEFMVKARVGNNLKVFVCEQLGVHETYFEKRVQTIFMNSKPVDDVAMAIVRDGAVLAFSAAMPGLVGATFRKGGRYSWMRSSISHADSSDKAEEEIGWVTVKLFNMILKELGPDFLVNGVWISGSRARAFFEAQSPEFLKGIRTMTLDGETLSPSELS